MTSAERRRFQRFSFRVPAEIEWGSSVMSAETRDLGEQGMFLATQEPLWVGATFSVLLRYEPPLRIDCVVRRVNPGKGMGVAFLDLDHHTTEQLRTILESLG